jgi:muramoyltetrapeptide carboxypeptidase
VTSILRPKALRTGDVVAIAALSNGLDPGEVGLLERGISTIEGLGFRVVRSPLVEPGRSYWWAVATPDEVVGELNRLLRDPDVRGIVALDGGRWVMGYVDRIDLDAIRADPKPIVGSSDISSLLLALHARTGFVGFHGAVGVRQFAEWGDVEPTYGAALSETYRRVLTGDVTPIAMPARAWETWRPGRAEGPLIGAMLNRLIRIQASSMALPPERFDGAILFWEEAWTSSSVIWGELQVLRSAGVLDRIAGMIVGATLDVELTEGGPSTLRDVVLDVVADRDIPVIGNVDIGHTGPNLPLPLGVRAELDADGLSLALVEPAIQV